MEEKEKNWAYFNYEVGRYEPGWYDDEKNFKPYKPETKKLVWYVFNEEHGEIVPINIFEYNWVFLKEGLLEAKKKYKDDFNKFADHIRRWLSHEYWARCQYETIVTSWPVYIDGTELDRLNAERERCEKEGLQFHRESVNPIVAKKLDIYSQVMLNWDRFIEYVWNNKRLITAKKLGIEDIVGRKK